MARPFDIEPTTNAISLTNGRGTMRFTVKNVTGRRVQATLSLLVDPAQGSQWAAILPSAAGSTEPSERRTFGIDATQSIDVAVNVPQNTSGGSYVLQLRAADDVNPDDNYSMSSDVTFVVIGGGGGLPKWVIPAALIVAVLIIALIAGVFYFNGQSNAHATETATAVTATQVAALRMTDTATAVTATQVMALQMTATATAATATEASHQTATAATATEVSHQTGTAVAATATAAFRLTAAATAATATRSANLTATVVAAIHQTQTQIAAATAIVVSPLLGSWEPESDPKGGLFHMDIKDQGHGQFIVYYTPSCTYVADAGGLFCVSDNTGINQGYAIGAVHGGQLEVRDLNVIIDIVQVDDQTLQVTVQYFTVPGGSNTEAPYTQFFSRQ